jgi:peptidoglycan/LPS O-acetylase OafA/YrhL
MAETASRYRPDIDGLRAIAVLAVLFNHLHPDLPPSGFLGVDVFFVISGFVVTASLQARPMLNPAAFLLGFYQRRVKRLLPALLLCVLSMAVITALVIPPTGPELTTSLRTAATALIGVSNLYLWRTSSDYFGSSAHLNPFTHTWSLGVEEQFYLLFPLLVLVLGASNRRLGLGLLALSLASLVLHLHLSINGEVASAFYLMPARFWELGIGALAFLGQRRNQPSGPLAWFSILLLLGALLLPKEQQTAGTLAAAGFSALLLFVLPQRSTLASWLSVPGLVRLGRLSYGLYLWHWPLLVLLRWTIGVNLASGALMLGLTLLIAEASFRWLEQPLRTGSWSVQPAGTLMRGLGMAGVGVGLLVTMDGPLRGRLYSGKPQAEVRPLVTLPDGRQLDPQQCQAGTRTESDSLLRRCSVEQADPRAPRVFFAGDSHAGALWPLAAALAARRGVAVEDISNGWCPFPSLYYERGGPFPRSPAQAKRCLAYGQARLAAIAERGRPGDSLVITSRLAYYFSSPEQRTPANVRSDNDRLTFQNQHGKSISLAEAQSLFANNLATLTASLGRRGIRVILISPTPEYDQPDQIQALCEPQWFRPELPPSCRSATPRQRHDIMLEQARLEPLFRPALQAVPKLHVIDSLAFLCPNPQKLCSNQSGGTLLYSDSNHLSPEGALRLLPPLEALLATNRV